VDPLNWFPKAWFNDGDWIKASSATPSSDWIDWFERAWFDEVEKPHTTVAKEMEKPHTTVAKEMEKPHNTVAKETEKPHTDDVGFVPQHPYSDTGHTVKPHTIDLDRTDNPHSNDWPNLTKASGGEGLKSLNYSHAVDATKAPNSHDLDTTHSHCLDEVATLILDYLYGLGQSNTIPHDLDGLGRCNKLPYDPGGLDPKQAPIEMEFGLLTRRTNGKDTST
jgi:hypothetical protein